MSSRAGGGAGVWTARRDGGAATSCDHGPRPSPAEEEEEGLASGLIAGAVHSPESIYHRTNERGRPPVGVKAKERQTRQRETERGRGRERERERERERSEKERRMPSRGLVSLCTQVEVETNGMDAEKQRTEGEEPIKPSGKGASRRRRGWRSE